MLPMSLTSIQLVSPCHMGALQDSSPDSIALAGPVQGVLLPVQNSDRKAKSVHHENHDQPVFPKLIESSEQD